MFELIGLIFGGVSRLAQHWLDLQDKQKEREHEAVMFDKQLTMMDRRIAAEADMRRMDMEAAETAGDFNALAEALKDQAAEAQAAGGWVAKFSASIRPLLTFWHCIAIYTAVKVAMFMGVFGGSVTWHDALILIYTDADRALCFSIVSFWFADRSLKKWAGK